MKILRSDRKFCYSCMQEHDVDIVEAIDQYKLKGIMTSITFMYAYCSNTDEYWETEEMFKANMAKYKTLKDEE